MSGGYLDPARNKIVAYRNFLAAADKYQDWSESVDNLQNNLNLMEASKKNIEKNIRDKEMQLIKVERSLAEAKYRHKIMLSERNHLYEKGLNLTQTKFTMEKDIKCLEASITNYQKELEEDFDASQVFDDTFEELVKNIQLIKKKFKESFKKYQDLNNEKCVLESNIEEVTKDLEADLKKADSVRDKKDDKEQLLKQLDLVTSQVGYSDENIKSLLDEESKIKNILKDLKAKKAEIEGRFNELNAKVGQNERQLEKLLSKKKLLSEQLQDVQTQLDKLGVVNSKLVDQFEHESKSRLIKTLKKVKKDLEKYDNVNKGAVNQLEVFTDLEVLNKRLDALLRDKDRILDLIEALDAKKDEQLNFTVKQLVKNFREIFAKIVPGGQGNIVLSEPHDDDDNMDEDDDEVARTVRATGLEITVSFTGNLEVLYREQGFPKNVYQKKPHTGFCEVGNLVML